MSRSLIWPARRCHGKIRSRPTTSWFRCRPRGEIILWSKRLNKRIIPRLTNAHNFSDGLPVYRFLCELTYQHDYRYLGWDWGHLSSSAFLPRVEYKHWVLSRAMWNIERETVTGRMGKDALSAAEWRILRKAYGIPRFVQLRHGDSELLIDGNSDFAVEVLCNAIRKYGKVTLAEFPEHDENGLLGEPGARYVHEIILPLIKRNDPLPEQPSPRQFRAMGPAAVKRDFIVGSEWLYVKIYTGTRTADRLLASVIKPFADRLVANGTIEKWFFVRFADPDHHIRLRFRQGNNPSFWQTVLTQLHPLMEPLLCNGTVHKVQLDTYKRELERYGRHAFEEVESIFFADSCAVSGLLGMLSGDEGEHYRWLIGLRGTDMLLDDMGFTPEHKKRLVGRLQEQFFREFGGDTNLNVQLNTKYRLHREEIARFLDPRQDASNRIEGAIRLFEGRSARVIASMAVLFPLAETDVGNFAGSLVHMFLNRLFVSQQREHELVVYHYLKKYYESKLARKENVPRKAFCGTDH
ncbi:thiopeptide-type bacteriocin biosynthesis protein [Dyadobacter sp. 676]|uniref:Thiopeptide-type bacteriocin biosynthesis protein n=1 Tax=Dyadobacter sp. 676 TaxID=3088362 RepID=A0AAU8FVS1_9BACT